MDVVTAATSHLKPRSSRTRHCSAIALTANHSPACAPRARLHAGGRFQVALGRTENLRQDRRKRQQEAAGVCPECGTHIYAAAVGAGPRFSHPHGHHRSTRSDRPASAVVVSLRTAMGYTDRIDTNVREAALDRSDGNVSFRFGMSLIAETDMLGRPDHVRCSGRTGSGWIRAKTTRLTQPGHLKVFVMFGRSAFKAY